MQDENKTLNPVNNKALTQDTGLSETVLRLRDLSDIAGTWYEDSEFDQVIEEQDRIDERA